MEKLVNERPRFKTGISVTGALFTCSKIVTIKIRNVIN